MINYPAVYSPSRFLFHFQNTRLNVLIRYSTAKIMATYITIRIISFKIFNIFCPNLLTFSEFLGIIIVVPSGLLFIEPWLKYHVSIAGRGTAPFLFSPFQFSQLISVVFSFDTIFFDLIDIFLRNIFLLFIG